jgi:hypothetical protein
MEFLGYVRLIKDSSRGRSEGLIATTWRDWGMLLWRIFVRWLMKPIPFPAQAYDMEPPETSYNQEGDSLPPTANADER